MSLTYNLHYQISRRLTLYHEQPGIPVPPPIVIEVALWRCLLFLTDWRMRKWVFRLMLLYDAALRFKNTNGTAIAMNNAMGSWRCRHENADYPNWVFGDHSDNFILYRIADSAHELRSRAYQFACRQGHKEMRPPVVWGLKGTFRHCHILKSVAVV